MPKTDTDTIWPFEYQDSAGDTLSVTPCADHEISVREGGGLVLDAIENDRESTIFLSLDAIRALHSKFGQHLAAHKERCQ